MSDNSTSPGIDQPVSSAEMRDHKPQPVRHYLIFS